LVDEGYILSVYTQPIDFNDEFLLFRVSPTVFVSAQDSLLPAKMAEEDDYSDVPSWFRQITNQKLTSGVDLAVIDEAPDDDSRPSSRASSVFKTPDGERMISPVPFAASTPQKARFMPVAPPTEGLLQQVGSPRPFKRRGFKPEAVGRRTSPGVEVREYLDRSEWLLL